MATMYNETEQEPFLSDEKDRPSRSNILTYPSLPRSQNLIIFILLVALGCSTVINIKNVIKPSLPGIQQQAEDQTPYAGLTWSKTIAWEMSTPYSSDNLTYAHEQWSQLDEDSGVVALPDAYTQQKNLPKAQRFPWDKSKGLYLLNGFHNLHCIKKLERALMEYQLGNEQSEAFGHIMHCLDSLRQDIVRDRAEEKV
ncbi:MAG: hypothetical protein Q9219_002842 [cf. Caloplaca sp. 3 TL-2023]